MKLQRGHKVSFHRTKQLEVSIITQANQELRMEVPAYPELSVLLNFSRKRQIPDVVRSALF